MATRTALGVILVLLSAPAVLQADPHPPRPARPSFSGMNVVIVGDVGGVSSLPAIEQRVQVLCGPGVDPLARPDAIEVITDVNLGPNWDRFEPIDKVIELARKYGLKVFLRVKPRFAGEFEKAKLRDTKLYNTDANLKDSRAISFFDSRFQQAVRQYYRAIAAHYVGEPALLGYCVSITPSGESQYEIEGNYFSDFSNAALLDYKSWMAGLGIRVTSWPTQLRRISTETRLATDRDYYLWAYWRVLRLSQIISSAAKEIKSQDPDALVSAMSYVENAAPAGYCPGLLDNDPNIDGYFSSISLDHGYFVPKNQDRSRPEVMGGSTKLMMGEFDLISAYTDTTHAEAFVRYFCLMNGQPRPFMPFWWKPGTKGGWSEGFWTGYSDDVARQMSTLVNRNKSLTGSESVADVAVIVPNVSGIGVMANYGPWQPEEFRATHADIVRHLSAIGANFDIITEDAVSTARLRRYKLVIVTCPALYPWVRTALRECKADILALGYAGTVVAPGPGDLGYSDCWSNGTSVWWPSGGKPTSRVTRIKFARNPLLGSTAGASLIYGAGDKPVTYIGGMGGTTLASDDTGAGVFAVADWPGKRRIYHFGLPLLVANQGRLLTDGQFREILTNILRESRCTAYGDLGPLRLYETSKYLLVENPRGTKGTLDKPEGDFVGSIPCLARRLPGKAWLVDGEHITLSVPAGRSIVIPLEAAREGGGAPK